MEEGAYSIRLPGCVSSFWRVQWSRSRSRETGFIPVKVGLVQDLRGESWREGPDSEVVDAA